MLGIDHSFAQHTTKVVYIPAVENPGHQAAADWLESVV